MSNYSVKLQIIFVLSFVAIPFLFLSAQAESEKSAEVFNHGLDYIFEHHSTLNGTNKTKNINFGNLLVSGNWDFDKIMPYQGWGLEGSIMATHGRSLSNKLGDIQTASNIDVSGINSFKVYQLILSYQFYPNHSLLAGLIDLSTWFNINQSALLFINSSAGTSAELGSSGLLGPSIYPYPSAGLFLNSKFENSVYVMAALMDQNAGNPSNPKLTKTQMKLTPKHYFGLTEIGLDNENRKLALGFWKYGEKFNDLSDTQINSAAPIQRTAQGGYVLFNYKFGRLDPFIRYGRTGRDIQNIYANLVLGFNYFSPLKREDDIFGVMVSRAYLSDKYKATNIATIRHDEVAYEAIYKIGLNKQYSFFPSFQYITHPSGRNDRKAIQLASMRFAMHLE